MMNFPQLHLACFLVDCFNSILALRISENLKDLTKYTTTSRLLEVSSHLLRRDKYSNCRACGSYSLETGCGSDSFILMGTNCFE